VACTGGLTLNTTDKDQATNISRFFLILLNNQRDAALSSRIYSSM
jgi:hypothetical protein